MKSRILFAISALFLALVMLAFNGEFAFASAANTRSVNASVPGELRSLKKNQLKPLKKLSARYQDAKSVSMKVDKSLKVGLIGDERQSTGKAWISKGRMRMELEGSEKTLLVINKKNIWAVKYPSGEFKDAAVQVFKGESSPKKAQSQALAGLLMHGGFLTYFTPTGVMTLADGNLRYFLQPTKDSSDVQRAQMTVSKDHTKILEIHYWDDRDNETTLKFSDIKFGEKTKDDLFNFTPPANADMLTM